MPFTIYIWIALIVAPFITWVAEELRMNWKIAAAITATVRDQTTICNGRVSSVSAASVLSSWNTLQTVRAGRAASRATPIELIERQTLCDADPLCRDRKKKKKK